MNVSCRCGAGSAHMGRDNGSQLVHKHRSEPASADQCEIQQCDPTKMGITE